MGIYIGVALGLLIGGLLVCALSDKAGYAVLSRIFWWLGILCACCGALLILSPIFSWLAAQMRSMLGAP